MKINDKKNFFVNIDNGNLFRYKNEIYMKTKITDSIEDFIYSVNVKNGEGITLGQYTEVEPIEGELTIL